MDSILEEMMTRLSELKNEVNAIGRLAKLMASKTIIHGEQQVEELEKEDIVRKAILEINNVYFTSTKGIRYLIRYSSDWIAVFRILVDWGMLKENSFSKFEEMCSPINSELRYPILTEKLRSGYYGLFNRPLTNKVLLTDQRGHNLFRRLTIAFEFENVYMAIAEGEEPVVKDIIPVWDSNDKAVLNQFIERYKTKERCFVNKFKKDFQ